MTQHDADQTHDNSKPYPPIGYYREEVKRLTGKLEQAERELAEERAENQLADELRHAASMRAVQMWRVATGEELAMPDQADMEVWLLSMIDDLKAELAEAEAKILAMELDVVAWTERVTDLNADLGQAKKGLRDERFILRQTREIANDLADKLPHRDYSVCEANECGGCADDNAVPCAEFAKFQHEQEQKLDAICEEANVELHSVLKAELAEAKQERDEATERLRTHAAELAREMTLDALDKDKEQLRELLARTIVHSSLPG